MRWLPALLLLVFGCGQPGHQPVPVSGKVTLDGKPLPEAHVRLIGEGFDPPLVQNPNGYTDADGSFKLTYLTNGDGAPPGKYKVVVTLHAKDKEGFRTGANTLPPKYSKPETSGLGAEVQASPATNELPAFELSSK